MVATQRADVPWSEIRSRVMKGESAHAIAKDMSERGIKLSRQAINQRARREQWPRGFEPAEVKAVESTFPNKLPNTWQPERAADFLNNVACGVSIELAAAAAGLNAHTIDKWRRANGDFDDLVMKARAERAIQRIGKIESKDDWRAQAWLVERDPLTKDQFGQQGGGGGNVNVVINVPRGDEPVIISGSKD